MKQMLASKLSALSSQLVSLEKRAVEIQTICQADGLPFIDPTIRLSAGLIATEVLVSLPGIGQSLEQLNNDPTRSMMVRVLQKTYPAAAKDPDDLIAALLATHEHSLKAKFDLLNLAFGMTEGTIGLWGQPIRRGPLWDK